MPIYEYECQLCHQRVELMQKVGDEAPDVCSCGARGTMRKLISPPMIQFKGSGWYVTDYAKKAPDSERDKADKKTAKIGSSGGSDSSKSGDDSAKP